MSKAIRFARLGPGDVVSLASHGRHLVLDNRSFLGTLGVFIADSRVTWWAVRRRKKVTPVWNEEPLPLPPLNFVATSST